MLRIAINGFGRIGRRLTRLALQDGDVHIVAINDLYDAHTMAHLFKYDSVHGPFGDEVVVSEGDLILGDQRIAYSQAAELRALSWSDLQVDAIVDCTGHFKTAEALSGYAAHQRVPVVLSVPSSDNSLPMVIMGVKEEALQAPLVSNASCTTNSAAPLVALLDELCGIESCYITTVHSYTLDQHLQDAPHRDLRRARAAGLNIVPTTTGAAKALTHIFPHLSVQIGGFGIRVPVPDGSLTDITCMVRTPKTAAEINAAFKQAASGAFAGILEYQEDPLVSTDIIGNRHSCIFDAGLTSVIGGMVKVIGWYDNETGYASRLLDLLRARFAVSQ